MLNSPPAGRLVVAAHRWALLALVGSLLLVIWAVVLWLLSLQHQRLLDESRRELAFMNDAVAQHAAGVFRAVESDLRVLDLWMRSHGDADPLHDPRFGALVDEMRRASGGLVDVGVVSSTGHLYGLPTPDGKPLADVKASAFFKAQQRTGLPALQIGVPERSAVTQGWGIPITWRLGRVEGQPRLLLAWLALDRVFQLHDGMRFKPEGTITLMRADGMVLSRTPGGEAYVGRDASHTHSFQTEYGVKPRGSFLSQGVLTDGVPRVVSYQRLTEYPVVVVVSRETEQVLAVFNTRRPIVLTLCTALTLAMLGFALLLQRAQRALYAAQQELRLLATTDELTGVLSRRALAAFAGRELARARRSGRPMAVLALDIDHFKPINDEHGHAMGDRVLAECCQRWQSVLREHDLLGRPGGEEFSVVLPETDAEAAALVAERLRTVLAERALQSHGQTVTVSIGLSQLAMQDKTWDEVLERADRALYRAKAAGRNRVVSDA